MKSVIRNAQKQIQFPKLMKTSNGEFTIVVLFIKPSCGTVIYNSNPFSKQVGEYSETFNMNLFVYCDDVIELSN